MGKWDEKEAKSAKVIEEFRISKGQPIRSFM
jgi:hypothetical protein